MTPEPIREPLALDLLLTDDQRRPVSVNDHAHFRHCISTDDRGVDEIDRELDEMIEVDPGDFNPPSRRKDSEVARMLELLDNLPTGKDSE